VEVEAQGVDAELVAAGPPTGAHVVVDVEAGDDVEDRLAHALDRGVTLIGDHVGVADVQADADRVRADSVGDAAEAHRVRRDGLGTRIERCEVLERDPDAEALGDRRQAGERPGLCGERELAPRLVGQRERVVDDLGGAELGGVGEQPLEHRVR
jgi:hypothetical protein